VRRGYQSNKLFEHTVTDVMRVMHHKIAKRNQAAEDALNRASKEKGEGEDDKKGEGAANSQSPSGQKGIDGLSM